MGVRFFVSLAASLCLLASEVSPGDTPEAQKAVKVGPGVTPPTLIYKVEPKYTSEALAAGIQGAVVFEIIVNEAGRATNLSVLSPLGFGLDEKAQQAIETWRFKPGMKEGRPVSVLATVEVNFRLRGAPFDSKAEKRRTSFNLALPGLSEPGKRRDLSVAVIQDLAKQKFPPAMYVLGKLLEVGQGVPPDPQQGYQLIRSAANKDYGPALFEVGLNHYEGKQEPRDLEKGMGMMRDAAILGSYEAQFYLGDRYERGAGVPREPDRARRYFRLCASRGQARCQIRLAKLLLGEPHRQERNYVQAVAWLQLAAAQGQAEARELVESELPRLTSEQISRAKRFQSQLVHSR